MQYLKKLSPKNFIWVITTVLLIGLIKLLGSYFFSNKTLLDEERCFKESGKDFSQVLTCYYRAQAKAALEYQLLDVSQEAGIEKRRYQLLAPPWRPGYMVSPNRWTHEVEIYIPRKLSNNQAFLIINSGINHAAPGRAMQAPWDFSKESLLSLARQTQRIVISVNYVPNQYLKYNGKNNYKIEDNSVGYTWKRFLLAPGRYPFSSLHIPMMASVVKTMDLAVKELEKWKITQFIVTGVSKRAWIAWLTAMVDERVVSIVPFVFDFLNIRPALKHTYHAYGKTWPPALTAYASSGIQYLWDTQIFEKFLQIEDPLLYLENGYAHRFKIPKLIVNASGDEFFISDNARFYFDQLPEPKLLRVVPNTGHFLKLNLVQTLVHFSQRLVRAKPIPRIESQIKENGANQFTLSLHLSEIPAELIQWTAVNPHARDFRYVSGIRYQPTVLKRSNDTHSQEVKIAQPLEGWKAIFIEARFKDGFIATTPVYVVPDTYP